MDPNAAGVWPFADDDLLTAAFAAWDALRGPRDVPLRADLSPLVLPPACLPRLALWEYVGPGSPLRARLVGQEICDRYGYNPRGLLTTEVHRGAYLDHVHAITELAWRERRPVYSESIHRWTDGGTAATRRLHFPLAGVPDGPVTHCYLVQTFPRDRDRPPPLVQVIPADAELVAPAPLVVRA